MAFLGLGDIEAVMAVAFVFACFTFYLNLTLGKKDEVKKIQKKIQDHQKELQKAIKENDQERLKQLQKKDAEVSQWLKDSMFMPMRAMIVILPAFWIMFAFVIPALITQEFVVRMPFHLPHAYTVWDGSTWRDYVGSKGLFIWSLVLYGLVFELIYSQLLPRIRGEKKLNNNARHEQ
ncbi:MAG: EMC3/TMCO1 family protein [Candidatus Micrarchaeota archaeon]